jgi:GDP/UDP-N,N'-diacetylbacillosamine 2-epimerase (hydrolysing)
MNRQRTICVVTGTRAEYGILFPLLIKLRGERSIKLQIIATGTHLSKLHGHTIEEIEKDGFQITKKVEMMLAGDTATACVKSTGLALIGLGEALAELNPDLMIALGDRFEMFAAASAANLLNIPICHIAGGEITEGAFDDTLRHVISKMSSLHFTTHDAYKKRVLQMGADPQTVINTGSLAIDNIRQERLLSRSELEEKLDLKIVGPTLLLTFHPETRSEVDSVTQLNALLTACFKHAGLSLIITEPNADPGAIEIKQILHEFAKQNPTRVSVFASLGRRNFLSLLQFVDGMIGNSSSGLSEAPASGIGTINIGNRQKGRLLPKSVLSVEPTEQAIADAIKTILNPGFKERIKGCEDFYGDGKTADRMMAILTSPTLGDILSTKFNDVP